MSTGSNGLRFETTGTTVTCYFAGQVSTIFCNDAEPQILEQVKNAKEVVFDIREVSFIASSFLRISARVAQIVGKDHFKIVNSSDVLRKVFQLAGFDKMLNIT